VRPDTARTFAARQHFATIGNFRHDPNVDSLWVLAHRSVWSAIRRTLPGAELHVYGAYMGREHMPLHRPDDGVLLKGKAKDAVSSLGKYRALLAPLRFGAGIKGKIADAWMAGTPVITSTIGAEGMTALSAAAAAAAAPAQTSVVQAEFGGIEANDSESFVSAAVSLYNDEARWSAAQRTGFDIVATRFQFRANADQIVSDIERRRIAHAEAHARERLNAALEVSAQEGDNGDKDDWTAALLWANAARANEFKGKFFQMKQKLNAALAQSESGAIDRSVLSAKGARKQPQRNERMKE
jgi:hypothetical protein